MAILVPVIVGIAIWGSEQTIGNALKPHKANVPADTFPALKPENDICSKLRINIQCTLTEMPVQGYVTRRSYRNLDSIPVCGGPSVKENAQFLKWAAANTIPAGINFLLDITSHTSAIVNLGTTQISVIKRYPSLSTNDITCTGGADYYISESVQLDSSPPKVTYICNHDKCSEPHVTLNKGDNVAINISTNSRRGVLVWNGRVIIIVNGHLITLNLGTHESASLPQPLVCGEVAPGSWMQCERS